MDPLQSPLVAAVTIRNTFSYSNGDHQSIKIADIRHHGTAERTCVYYKFVSTIHPGGSAGALAVNFQEVVHSIRTGNADVAKPQ
jgi:hypothetical protein